jgi:hypothetical protein
MARWSDVSRVVRALTLVVAAVAGVWLVANLWLDFAKPEARKDVVLAAPQKGAIRTVGETTRGGRRQGEVKIVEVARCITFSMDGKRERHLKVVLRLSGVDARGVRWEPLSVARDDTGRSLLPTSTVAQVTASAPSGSLHEYRLHLPSPQAKKISMLAGKVRVSVPTRAIEIRFDDPLQAIGQTRQAGPHKVTLKSIARREGKISAVIEIEPPPPLFPSTPHPRGYRVMSSQQRKSGAPPHLLAGKGAVASFTLELADGSSHQANNLSMMANGSSASFDISWAGIPSDEKIKALRCELVAETAERHLLFKLADIPLP